MTRKWKDVFDYIDICGKALWLKRSDNDLTVWHSWPVWIQKGSQHETCVMTEKAVGGPAQLEVKRLDSIYQSLYTTVKTMCEIRSLWRVVSRGQISRFDWIALGPLLTTERKGNI